MQLALQAPRTLRSHSSRSQNKAWGSSKRGTRSLTHRCTADRCLHCNTGFAPQSCRCSRSRSPRSHRSRWACTGAPLQGRSRTSHRTHHPRTPFLHTRARTRGRTGLDPCRSAPLRGSRRTSLRSHHRRTPFLHTRAHTRRHTGLRPCRSAPHRGSRHRSLRSHRRRTPYPHSQARNSRHPHTPRSRRPPVPTSPDMGRCHGRRRSGAHRLHTGSLRSYRSPMRSNLSRASTCLRSRPSLRRPCRRSSARRRTH